MNEEHQQIIMFMDHYANSDLLKRHPDAKELATAACDAYELWYPDGIAWPAWVYYAAQMVVAIREEGDD